MLLESASEAEMPAGAELIREGEPGRELYVILRGTALVTKGGRKLRELVPGDFFGEMALLEGRPRLATVRAYSDLRMLVIGPSNLEAIMQRERSVANELRRQMDRRLEANRRTAPP